jgi:predicted dehydrogenase
VGGRARFFYEAIPRHYAERAEVVAFCDVNQTRLDLANKIHRAAGGATVPTYRAEQFDRMIADTRPDAVIVTSIDRTHHRYIVRAMELGCDAITEKPMTIDAEKCQQILDAIHRTGRELRVTFNYRYAPHSTKVRELLMADTIGQVFSVHFEWLLDLRHGADYFRRWHRDKRNSGGLLVHKATHHFDLVNFWLASAPLAVAAFGELAFYGRANAEERGETRFYARAHGSDAAAGDPFALDLAGNETLREMYLQAEHEDGYLRDQSVFGDGISIEDTLGLLVRMRNGAMLTYALTAYAPWEGFRLSMTGTAGRIEAHQVETSYVSAGGQQANEAAATTRRLRVLPMFGDPYEVDLEEAPGAHGGADPRILHDLFGERADDPLSRAASHVDGANAILTGIAGNVSMRTGRIVHIADLIDWSPPQ